MEQLHETNNTLQYFVVWESLNNDRLNVIDQLHFHQTVY